MKLVIYITTHEERLKLEEQLFGLPIRAPTNISFEDDIKWFKNNDHGVLILNIKAAATGWIAPPNTAILFTGTVPNDAYKMQAMARAGVVKQ